MPEVRAVDPSTGQVLETYPPTSEDRLRDKLGRALASQRAWAERPFTERGEILRGLADGLRRGKRSFAERMTREMGKPIGAAEAEVDKCAWVCDYYAEHGAEFLAERRVETDATCSFVAFRPLGLVLAIMPWNFPFWQFFRCAAPALMAGNGMLLKHASNVPGCALAIEALCDEVPGLEGLATTLLIDGPRALDLIAHDAVAAVTLTGSTAAGKHVAKAAGAQLKKCVLELGGSDPYIVLEDADLELAARTCVDSRMINNGQSCIAAKRFIAVDRVHDAFCELVASQMEAIDMGDPMLAATRLGPMARSDLRDELHQQVRRSIEQGATLRVGGSLPDRPGAFYPATLLTGVRPGMPAFDEELFGPVAAIVRANGEQHALELANASEFGLGGAVFSRDVARATQLARDGLEVGAAFVNALVRSDPRLPFGGIKRSGYGRELGSFGILEFVNIKTIYVA